MSDRYNENPFCWRCDTERHICPGCGVNTDHYTYACYECQGYIDLTLTNGTVGHGA